MLHREYDIILYGAGSFTAKYIIKELEKSHLKIALGARSKAKIPKTFLPRMECSIDTLQTLTAKTRLLINLVGPYAFTGRNVISACISTSTHYIDISGETQFLKDTLHAFDEDAKRCGIKIIQGCGFDSVPADIGAMFLSRYFDCLVIDSTVRAWSGRINKGTWMSLLNSLREHREREAGDRKTPEERKNISPKEMESLEQRVHAYRYNRRTKSYDVSFKSSDSYIVRRSSRYFQETNRCAFKYIAYLNVGSLLSLGIYFVFVFLITLLAKFSSGYNFLVNHPRLCSFGIVREEGPSHQEICNSRFEIVLNGTGYRNQKPVKKSLKITGPDPGYLSTSVFVTECAYLLLENEGKIEHGVLTPAQAYHTTNIVDRLSSRGVYFQVQNGLH